MIDLYGMGSPNVVKVVIMLEEIGRPYKIHYVSVLRGESQTPAFRAINPLGKVPALVDHDGAGEMQPIFESGAILIYLAETYKSPLLASSGPERWEALKWLMFQMSFFGPMLGQVNHFQLIPSEAHSYGATRYREQAARAYGDLETRLSVAPWVAGENYSIADIALYPWAGYLARHGFAEADYPHIMAWRHRLDARPAVKRAYGAIAALEGANAAASSPRSAADLDQFFGRIKPGPTADFASYMALGPFASVQPD